MKTWFIKVPSRRKRRRLFADRKRPTGSWNSLLVSLYVYSSNEEKVIVHLSNMSVPWKGEKFAILENDVFRELLATYWNSADDTN